MKYWKKRCRWIVVNYFIALICFIMIDKTLMFTTTILFGLLPLIYESTKIDFDYSRTGMNKMDSFKTLLPIKKKELKLFYLLQPLMILVISLFIITLFLFLGSGHYEVNSLTVRFNLIFGSIYVLFLVVDYFVEKPNYLYQQYKRYYYVYCLLGVFIMNMLVQILNSEWVEFYGNLTNRFNLMILIILLLPLVFSVLSLNREDDRQAKMGKYRIKKSIRSISRFSKYNYTVTARTPLTFLPIGVLIYNIFSGYMNVGVTQIDENWLLTCLFLFLFLFGVSIQESLKSHFDSLSFIKLVPVSKKTIFLSALYDGFKRFLVGVLAVLVTLLALFLIRNNSILFTVNFEIGYLLLSVILFYIVLFIVVVGYAKNDDGFYAIIGIIVMIVITIILCSNFDFMNQYWYAVALVILFVIWSTYKQIFEGYKSLNTQKK